MIIWSTEEGIDGGDNPSAEAFRRMGDRLAAALFFASVTDGNVHDESESFCIDAESDGVTVVIRVRTKD